MIYFRFTVARPDFAKDDGVEEALEYGVAEVAVAETNPWIAAQTASGFLRNQGWQPMAVTDAVEGFVRDDFRRQRAEALFVEASLRGLAWRLAVSDGVEAMSQLELSATGTA
jgi:hypothetical protein